VASGQWSVVSKNQGIFLLRVGHSLEELLPKDSRKDAKAQSQAQENKNEDS
jgi:hypothetical protein